MKDPRAWPAHWPGSCLGRRRGRSLAPLLTFVLSSAGPHLDTLLTVLFAESRDEPPPATIMEPLFALAGSIQDRQGMKDLVRAAPARPPCRAVGSRPGNSRPSPDCSTPPSAGPAVRSLRPRTTTQTGQSPRPPPAVSRTRPRGRRERSGSPATARLGREPNRRDEDRDLLAGLLRPQVSGSLQNAAVSAAGADPRPEGAPRRPTGRLAGSLAPGPGRDPRCAPQSGRLDRRPLLSSLEDLCTPAAEIDPAHRRRLLDHRDPDVGVARREPSSSMRRAPGRRSSTPTDRPWRSGATRRPARRSSKSRARSAIDSAAKAPRSST